MAHSCGAIADLPNGPDRSTKVQLELRIPGAVTDLVVIVVVGVEFHVKLIQTLIACVKRRFLEVRVRSAVSMRPDLLMNFILGCRNPLMTP